MGSSGFRFVLGEGKFGVLPLPRSRSRLVPPELLIVTEPRREPPFPGLKAILSRVDAPGFSARLAGRMTLKWRAVARLLITFIPVRRRPPGF